MKFSQMDDLTILKMVNNQNPGAFYELYNRYKKYLEFEAYNQLRNEEDAEEAANDVLISIWQRKEEIEIHVMVKTYLFNAIRNHSLYKLRGDKRRQCLTQLAEDHDMGLTNHEDPLKQLENKEKGQITDRAIACITSASGKQAFEMYFLYSLPQKVIAVFLSVPLNSVKKLISRARKEVVNYLNKHL